MGSPLKIKEDRTPAELRRLARRERGGRIAARLYAIANALDGMSRAAAAQLAGMERQALRRIDGGSLSAEEVERLGQTFMLLEQRMEELKDEFGLEDEDLNLDLGPLGQLI